MSKAVLTSIQPFWCVKIASGEKTVEVRKTRPKLEPPFKCYIYCTNKRPFVAFADVFRGNWETEVTTITGYNRKEAERIWDLFNGKVIGEFVCDKIFEINVEYNVHDELPGSPVESWLTWEDAPDGYENAKDIERATCLTLKDINGYIGAGDLCYCWHISGLDIYDTPKELSAFYNECPGLNNTGMCWDCEKAVGEEFDCATNGRQFLTRPPQSWCYVEEVA